MAYNKEFWKPRQKNQQNKYNLTPADIDRFELINPEALKYAPFQRDDEVCAYYIQENTAESHSDFERGNCDIYTLHFYDDDAPQFAGRIVLRMTSCGDLFTYRFKEFYDKKQTESHHDYALQRLIMERVNWLIDEGICRPTTHSSTEYHNEFTL